MTEALGDFNSRVSIGGRKICNLRFADDIDLLASTSEELQMLTNNLAQSSGRFGMDLSCEKSKVMINTTDEKPHTSR